MPEKPKEEQTTESAAREFFGGKLPPAGMDKLLEYVKEESAFATMPRHVLLGLLNSVFNDVNSRLSYDKVEELAISAQKKAGLEPYDWFSTSKEKFDLHQKTAFEKFSDYCETYAPKRNEYNPKRRISMKDFSLYLASGKLVEWHLDQFCRKNEMAGKPLGSADVAAIRHVLDEMRNGMPAIYGEIFAGRLKREIIFKRMMAADDSVKTGMAFKGQKAADGVPQGAGVPQKR